MFFYEMREDKTMFDTHVHLDDSSFEPDRNKIIEGLYKRGVMYVLNASSDLKSSYLGLSIARKYGFVYCAAGVHPHETKNMSDNDICEIEKILINEDKCVAIGEIGLDYYYDISERDIQKYWFEKQMQLAEKLSVPVIIHDRDAHGDCLAIIKKYNKVKGVFHCYSGSVEMAEELVSMGWYISFTGVLTFKNAKKAVEVAKAIDINKIFIETDCPYMSPEPFRGTRNEPGNVRYVCEKLAQIKNMTFAEIEKMTQENAIRFFNIK